MDHHASSRRAIIGGLFLLGSAALAADGAKPPLCTDGRFAIQRRMEPASPGEGLNALIVLANHRVTVCSPVPAGETCELCASRKATFKRLKIGTKVRSTSQGECLGLRPRGKLAALITDDCTVLAGTLKFGRVRFEFEAAPSRCGDGVIDTARGEKCEQSSDCDAGQRCDDACDCVATTTTTTPPAVLGR